MDEVKILGLILDKKLTWIQHKVLSAKNWGADMKVLINTYKALLQSKIDYGCATYDSAKPSVLQRLDVLLNSSMRIAVGASLLSECNMIPLNLRRKNLQQNTL